uniref:Tc1-like transposase DDE domain-containing protein n=1 Tax=Oryzias melastigma TaxID=30732 RepID=A0A3B3CJR7_ORYME
MKTFPQKTPNFLCMYDNIPPHAAMFPDLNPVEHIWDQLKSRLDDCIRPPSDLTELHEALFMSLCQCLIVTAPQ